jgi:hypothetical protein
MPTWLPNWIGFAGVQREPEGFDQRCLASRIAGDGGAPKKRKPFRTKSFECGRVLIDSVDNVWEVLDQIEGDKFR